MTKSTKFKPGQSGNPKGKPKGAKDKRTAYRDLFQDRAPELISKAIELALKGDRNCLRMCIDRIVSPYRASDPSITLEPLEGALTEQGRELMSAAQKGHISPTGASALMSALESQARILKLEETLIRDDEETPVGTIVYNVKPAVGDVRITNGRTGNTDICDGSNS